MCSETSPISPVEIKQALLENFLALQYLLNQANAYSLGISGRPMWENSVKAEVALKKELLLGNVFIICGDEDAISSSITLSETSDEWGELGRDGKALYFMKLMKNPDKARQNEIRELLKFVATEAKKRGKTFIRCDTLSDNGGIIAYYKKIGFQEKDYFQYKLSSRRGVLLEISSDQLFSYLSS